MRINPDIPIDQNAIAQFCKRWRITGFALFGSALRDDFGPQSDVDVLVSFEPGSDWSYWNWPDMIGQLEAMFGRSVDLVVKEGLRNPFRRHAILTTREVIHAA